MAFWFFGEEEVVVVMADQWGWGSSEENGGGEGGVGTGGEEGDSNDYDGGEASSVWVSDPQIVSPATVAAASAQKHGMTVEE